MSSGNNISQPSDNSVMSGNQTESTSLASKISELGYSHCQYPEKNLEIELGARTNAVELNLLPLLMTRSEEPNTTNEHVHQTSHADLIQLESSLVNPSEHLTVEPALNPGANQTEETEDDDLKKIAADVAVQAIGVSVPGIFGIGQLFRRDQVCTQGRFVLLTASLMLLCTSFITGIFLFVFSKTDRNFHKMLRIIQFLLWSAAVSATLGILLGAVHIALHGLQF